MRKTLLLSALLLTLPLTACTKTLTEKYTVEGKSLVYKDETLLTADTSMTLTDSFLIVENSESFDLYIDRRAASGYAETATILFDDFVKVEGSFDDAALFDGSVLAADGNTLVYLVPGDAMITSENHEKLLDVSEYGALVIADGRLLLTDGIGEPLPSFEFTPETLDAIPVWSWDNIDAHSIHDHGAMIRCGKDVYSVTDTGSAKKIEFDELLTLHPIGASVVVDEKYRLVDREGKTLTEWDGYQSGMELVTEILTDYKGEYYSDGAVYNLRFDDGTSGGFLLSYDVTTGRLLKKNGAYNFSFNADGKIDVVMNKVEHKGTYDDIIDFEYPLLLHYSDTNILVYNARSIPIEYWQSVQSIQTDGEYLVTEHGVFDKNLNYVLYFGSYADKPSVDSVTITDYGVKAESTDHNGIPITIRWYAELPEAGNIPQDMNLIDNYYEYGGLYGDGKSYWIVKDTGEITKLPLDKTYPVAGITYDNQAFFYETSSVSDEITIHETRAIFPKQGLLMIERTIQPESLTEYGDYYVAFDLGFQSLILDKNGEIYDTVDYHVGFIKDDLLYFGFYDDVDVRAVYSSSMKRFSDEPFVIFNPLDDGRYIAQVGNRYEIYTKDGDLVCRSGEFEQLLYVDDVILFVENGEMVVAEIVPGTVDYILERNTKLGEYDSEWIYHVMLSGKIEKPVDGYPTGYYFVFQDVYIQDETGAPRNVEYYYVPETGETGIYEYYADFAYAKPVLYLYPEETVDVTVTFPNAERLTTVYPAYNDGWRVTVLPDGTLTDARGREYYALYWEEDSGEAFYAFPDGFVVTPDNATAFLEEKLAILGLTDREANEFIMYWLPILEQNPYNLVRFELTEERERAMPMHITPSPDSLLRIAIHILPLDAAITIPEQKLSHFTRNGFTAVEWGGCIHS